MDLEKANNNKLLNINVGSWLIHHRKHFICRVLSKILFNCEVSLAANIHSSVIFHHNGMGVMIESNVVIEEGVEVDANVTIGYQLGGENKSPVIKKYCKIGTGCIIVGDTIVNSSSIITVGSIIKNGMEINKWKKS